MRIVIATDGFLKMISGQIGGFRSLGHDVLLLCRDHALEFGGDQAERDRHVAEIGVPVVELAGRRLGPETLPSVAAARRKIKQFNPDVVLVHENLDPRLLLVVRGFPIVYTIHDPTPHPGANPDRLTLRIAASSWKKAAKRFVVHGERLVDELPDDIRSRKATVVIAHGAEVRAHPLPTPAGLNVLLFGRLTEYKGVDVLVKAMNSVWASHPDATLTVAGRGPESTKVPTDPRINLIDHYIPENEVNDLFRAATVCVLPYTQASQSGVGLLALSMGVPTVVTDVGALADLAENRSRLVPAADPQALAAAISDALACGPSEREATLTFARDKFAWESVAVRYESLFKELTQAAAR